MFEHALNTHWTGIEQAERANRLREKNTDSGGEILYAVALCFGLRENWIK